MSIAQEAAESALESAVASLKASGLLAAIRDLQRTVWAVNIDRYEPEELGDTPRALGLLSFENFTQRAIRRYNRDELEPSDKHWNIDGLKVTTPDGVLTFELEGVRIVGMKVPPAQRRSPDWDRFADWDNESEARRQIAQKNSRVLCGYSTPLPGQGVLTDIEVDLGSAPGAVCDFLYVWAGEFSAPLTSGWLTVPVVGGTPFAAVQPLWRDTDDDLMIGAQAPSRGPGGPSFEEKPAARPAITLKPRPAAEGEA